MTEQVGEARQVRVTVVNNDTDFLSLMKEVLADRGWETTVIRESGSAYRLIKEHQPDVLLLDIRMETPESGWNVLELLKLDPETRDIPVVVCSAAALDVRAKEEWLHDRGIDVLVKPFEIDDLYLAVEKAMLNREGEHVRTMDGKVSGST
ncbi:MAG TPA: response regulator [Chloroflexota bacterium]|nr:response regulator [Chloroflexota bacterium]